MNCCSKARGLTITVFRTFKKITISFLDVWHSIMKPDEKIQVSTDAVSDIKFTVNLQRALEFAAFICTSRYSCNFTLILQVTVTRRYSEWIFRSFKLPPAAHQY